MSTFTKEAAYAAIHTGALLPSCCLRRSMMASLTIVSTVATVVWSCILLAYAANGVGSGMKFVGKFTISLFHVKTNNNAHPPIPNLVVFLH